MLSQGRGERGQRIWNNLEIQSCPGRLYTSPFYLPKKGTFTHPKKAHSVGVVGSEGRGQRI